MRALILLFFLLPACCFPQHVNRYKNKEKQGKWIIYYNEETKQIDNVGRYRKGDMKGKWKWYDPQGKLSKTEIHRFKKIKTTYYHPNGKIKKQGMAKQVLEERHLHFYYYGEWREYDSTGTLITKMIYENGHKISETDLRPKNKRVNDSLVAQLKRMNQSLYTYSDSLIIAERDHGTTSIHYQRALMMSDFNALKALEDLDSIIAKHGFPGKTLLGEKDQNLAFSLVSTANIKYKEKYYELIIAAADKKDLLWEDVACFVDKVKIGRKEKQVYATQFKLDLNQRTLLYYPVEELERLNERRKKVGLAEMDISQMQFTVEVH